MPDCNVNHNVQRAGLVEDRGVGTAGALLGHRVLSHLARRRIELADVVLRNAGEPDVAHGILRQAMRSRIGWQGMLRHDARRRIEPAQHAGPLPGPPHGPIRSSQRIMRSGAEAGQDPFVDGDAGVSRNHHGLGRRLYREVSRQIASDHICLIRGQVDHRAEQIRPSLPCVSPGVGDQVEPMTRRAMSLDQFLPSPLGQLDRLAPALSLSRRGKNEPQDSCHHQDRAGSLSHRSYLKQRNSTASAEKIRGYSNSSSAV